MNDREKFEGYLEECVALAERTKYFLCRPFVGAIVIAGGKVVGKGFRQIIDYTSFTIHAERAALNELDWGIQGEMLVTTLEPCTPKCRRQSFSSCCELIVERGIREVVIGVVDNSPSMVPGRGIEYLRSNGIEVHYGPWSKDLTDVLNRLNTPNGVLAKA